MNKETVQGKTEKTVGHVKKATGELTGDQHLQVEGATEQLKGQLRETIGAVKQVGENVKAGIKEGKESARDGA